MQPAVNGGPSTDVLFLCTGNICRSAYAALWLRHATEGRITVASAGTGAAVGKPAHEEIERLLAPRGIPTEHVAQQLTPALMADAALVIGMTRDHRALALNVFPGALRRTVTLLEIEILAPYIDTADWPGEPRERVRAIAPAVMRARGKVSATDSFDIEDPIGQSSAVFDDMGAVMDRALPVLRDLILGAPAPA